MDRKAFLQALPFLSPLSSGTEWPPPSINKNGTCCEVILKDYMLSVEPKNAGPACFASPEGQDPALFQIDVSIVTTTTSPVTDAQQGKDITSPAESSVSTSLSLSQTSRQPSQEHATGVHEHKSRMHVILHLDNKLVFQVHLAQLCRVQLHEKQTEDKELPHVLLEFDSCSFRVFSREALGESGDSGTSSGSSAGNLKTAASRLKKAASAFEKRPILQEHEEYLLPMDPNTEDSASLASDIAAQRQFSNDETDGASKNEGRSSMRCIKRKRSALDRSWDGMHALQAVLNMPHDTAAAHHQGEDGVAETIAPILNKSAEELASSYCHKNELRGAIQNCSNEIASCEAQLNNVFAAGFPPPTRNRRNGASPAKTPLPEEATETLLETAQTLLKKQKAAMRERLELSLLPTRG